jgi:cytochrome c biogenesis protein CcdA
MAFGTLGLAFLAGLLSILSPCVLPLLPIVLGRRRASIAAALSPSREGSRSPSSPSGFSLQPSASQSVLTAKFSGPPPRS